MGGVRLAEAQSGEGASARPMFEGPARARQPGDDMTEATGEATATGAVDLTDRAAEKVRELIDDEGNERLKLRVFVTGGGCSGFSYGFTFDEEASDDDVVVERAGVTLLVDHLSLQYLAGSSVDYGEDLGGAQFRIQNPQASTTCGCGNSFSV